MERAISVAVGDRQQLTCLICSALNPNGTVCKEPYDELAIKRSTQNVNLRKAYDVVVAQKALHNTEIPNTYRCPFCDNAVILESDVNTYSRFRCNGCSRVSCRRCRTGAHEGSCDPQRRREEEETETFLVTCYCGSRFYRGDGCNKVTCDNCRKRWCWLCKANLGATSWLHFRNEHDINDKRCRLYGERTTDQRYSVPLIPARIPTVRRRVDVDREQPERCMTIEFPCLESGAEDQVVAETSRPGRCAAKLKIDHRRSCPYKAKQDGFCLKHHQHHQHHQHHHHTHLQA